MFAKTILLLIALIATAMAFAPIGNRASRTALQARKAGNPFAKGGSSASSSTKTPAKAAAEPTKKAGGFVPKGAIITKFGAWGGRPDATPEMQAPEKTGFVAATWRYGRSNSAKGPISGK